MCIRDRFPNYALAIIVFTCLVMIVLTPVTLKQTRSMLAMQKVAPVLKKLRKKHGNDRDRLNQEMMALYQANGINPLAGCLPLIAQMPIFFALFYTVRGLTRRTGEVGLRLGDVSTIDPSNASYIPELNARVFNPYFIGTDPNVAEENIQARIRGNILMAISNKFGWMVLSTGNKTEVALGYCTLYGDMSGGLSVISDLSKTDVYSLSKWINNNISQQIPESIINIFEKPIII